MDSKIVLLIVLSLVVLTMTTVSAFAINGHGISIKPEFGGGKLVKYSDGLAINGKSFSIAKKTQTIPTQSIHSNQILDLNLKIYHSRGPDQIQHVIVFFNTQGNNPQASSSDTWVEFDRTLGNTIHDPNKNFKSVQLSPTSDNKFFNLDIKIQPDKTINNKNIIIRAWDKNNGVSEVAAIDAISIQKILGSYSVIS